MKIDNVPQDDNKTYGGYKRILYAVDDNSCYEKVESSGWETEEFATLMAVDDFREQALAAHERCKQGVDSPLAYHMYNNRLDILSLAQASGFFQWTIRRHLRPQVFNALSKKTLTRYSEIFDIDVNALMTLPKEP